MKEAPRVLVIAGPTASGKTAAGIALAQMLDGEIVSADARQVYREMDIGTAKPTPDEQAAVPHHLINVVNPDETYSAGQFAVDAAEVLHDILNRGKHPLVVGGAGLYLKALFEGFAPMPGVPTEVRQRVQMAVAQNIEAAYRRLGRIDPVWAGQIQPTDVQRIVRGLEVFETTGKPLTFFQRQPRQSAGKWATAWFALHWPRPQLYKRINLRAEQMFENGVVEEVKLLAKKGYSPSLNALNTFGYREIFRFLAGELTLESALAELQQGTRRYAKRQMTWFRGQASITWIDAHKGQAADAVLHMLKKA